jgi:type VI protein secretion system component VasA
MYPDTDDWKNLSDQQKADLEYFRREIAQYLMKQAEEFHTLHPDLQLTFNLTIDASFLNDGNTLS